MGYEIKVKFHPKKKEGFGYDAEKVEEEVKQVGKPFEDTGLEKLAGVVMSQMARRDVMVVDFEIFEFVRRQVSFKEANDGKGIILKNKKFALDQTAQLIAADFTEASEAPDLDSLDINDFDPSLFQQLQQTQSSDDALKKAQAELALLRQMHAQGMSQSSNATLSPLEVAAAQAQGLQPHEIAAMKRQSENIDDLYSNPNAKLPVRQLGGSKSKVNPNKVLYHAIFEPYGPGVAQARALKLQFTEGERYKVHAVRPDPRGGAFGELLSITDNKGRVVEVSDTFFTAAGQGLVADELGFSNKPGRETAKLSYADESYFDGTTPPSRSRSIDVSKIPPQYRGIPLDDGSVPVQDLHVPNLRPGKQF